MKFNKSSAYTLIEVLVSMMIIALLVAVGYANYRDFGRRQELAGISKILQGNLRRAQQSALSGVKPDDAKCNPPETLISHDFYRVSESEYRIRANCTGGNVVVEDITLPSTVTIATSKNPIVFKVLGAGTNITDSSEITLTQVATGKTTTITISSGGSIQ